MAGIGFELRRMIDQRTGFVAKVRAYACAGLISSGPWLMTILTLTLLNVVGPYLGSYQGYRLFRALVTYAFAFSLILQGVAQMAITRKVADLLYAKRYEKVLPAFAASLLVTGLVHIAIGAAFSLWARFDIVLGWLATTLFAITGMTWIALIWLSVARQYDEVLRAYIYGTLVAVVGVLLLMLGKGASGILGAYTAGQAFTLVLLIRTIARGMESGGGREFRVWKSLWVFPRLALVGLLYNAAIWVDKMVFWFRDGIGPHPLVRYHPLYDTCSFLAYLTVVPALAVNLIRLETSFYERYRAYYGAILGGTPLAVIEDRKRRMLGNLEESVVRLLRVQGAITIVCILFAPPIIRVLELPDAGIRLFRLACLGAFFHVLLLINILMQMYFDLRAQALATSLVFLLLNGTLALWSVGSGVETFGVGYALASFLSLLLGYVLLHRSLDRLDYMTFTNQPIGTEEERREAKILAEQAREAEEEEEGDEESEAPVRRVPVVASTLAAGEQPSEAAVPTREEPAHAPAAADPDEVTELAPDLQPEEPHAAPADDTGIPVTPQTATTATRPRGAPKPPERIVLYPQHEEPHPKEEQPTETRPVPERALSEGPGEEEIREITATEGWGEDDRIVIYPERPADDEPGEPPPAPRSRKRREPADVTKTDAGLDLDDDDTMAD